jgi:Tol biopolymer transport system component
VRILLAFCAAFLLLSVGPGATAGTSVPPRNGLIAVSGPEGIYVVDPRAGTTTLIPDTTYVTDPAWSPDGTRLAVSSFAGERSNVVTMKPDGSDRNVVLENAYSPAWSPDGKELVVVREGTPDGDMDGTSLAIAAADGGDARTIDLAGSTELPYVSAPEWSPDGKLIAFVSAGGSIGLVTPDGKEVSMPVETTVATGVSWSPDSTKLAFDRDSGKKGNWDTVVLDLATGKQSLVTGEKGSAQSPTWSPEGDQLAFLSTSAATTTVTAGCGAHLASHLWVAAPDGTKAHRLVKGEYYGMPSWGRASEAAPAPVADEQPAPAPSADEQPAPAPPAEQEPAPVADQPPSANPPAATAEPPKPQEPPANISDEPSTKGLIAVRGSNGIYLVDPDSAAAHKVPNTADMIAPAWSPDGSLLAAERVDEGGASSVYTIKPDGTQPQLVVKNASAPSWSAAGDAIFVVRNECSTPCEPEDDEANVRYSVRPDGSGLQRVDLEADVNDPRELAWRSDGSPLWFFEDGSAGADGPGTFDSSAAAWSPDETQIAFIGALGPSDDDASADTITAGLWIVSADGGTPRLLLKGASGWPSWPS